jgi:hypothetical protein
LTEKWINRQFVSCEQSTPVNETTKARNNLILAFFALREFCGKIKNNYYMFLQGEFKLKKYVLAFVLLGNVAFAQTAPAPIIPVPSYQQKFNLFNTNQLTQINTSLESRRNKNFVIDYKSLLVGNDLKNAEEHDLNVKYGIKSMFGGVLSANMSNVKTYNSQKDNEVYGLNYVLSNGTTSLNFAVKTSDTVQTQYKGMPTKIYQLDIKTKF